MYFWLGDDDLLKKYNIVWKSDIALKKNLKKNSKEIKKYSKTKIRHYNDETTDFNTKLFFLKKYNYIEKEKEGD